MAKELEVEVAGKHYVVKMLTLGEDSEIVDKSTSIDPTTMVPLFSTKKLRLYTIKAAAKLVEADGKTRELGEQEILSMDKAEGMELFNQIQAFNRVPLGASPSSS